MSQNCCCPFRFLLAIKWPRDFSPFASYYDKSCPPGRSIGVCEDRGILRAITQRVRLFEDDRPCQLFKARPLRHPNSINIPNLFHIELHAPRFKANMSQPTLLIIPGSFSPPALYKNLVDNLRSLGFETIVEPLQSAIRKESPPSSSMYDDASHFRNVITNLADQGKDIVLIPHSYGGIVANESAKGLLKSDRSKAGKTGGIVEIINISTLTPAVGQSGLDVAGKLGLDQFPVEVRNHQRTSRVDRSLTQIGRIHGPRRRGMREGELQ